MLRIPQKLEKKDGQFDLSGKSLNLGFSAELDYSFLAELAGLSSVKREEGKEIVAYVGEKANLSCEYDSEEAYALNIDNNGITVAANTEKGLSQGIKMLAVLYRKYGSNIPALNIQDAPAIKFRGTHICIFNPLDGTEKDDTSPASVKELILNVALAGYNYVFLEFWGMFPYKKMPYACWPHSEYTRPVVEDLISYIIDKLHITPLPCQNLTSHAGWSRIASRKHVVLDQRPDLSDMWIPGGWCFATENPDTKEFLKNVMDDLIETFRNPPYFHVSCDKCFGFGSTEEDRTKPADGLFMTHLCNLNTYLQSKGVRMVMWGDMLYSSMDSLYWKPNPIIADQLPKNILINIWTHNDVGEYWADIDYFESRGYETIYSPFINKKGTESMVKLCANKNSLGILQTTWHRPKLALPNVIYCGALCWCGYIPSDKEIKKHESMF